MANTAFEHSPTITVPGSGNSTDNAVVLWNGTTGNNFSNSVVIINSGAVTGVTTLAASTSITTPSVLLSGSSNTLTLDVAAVTAAYTIILPDAVPGATGKILQTSGSDPWSTLVWADAAAIVPTTITIADTTNTTCFVGLFEDPTGDRAPKTDGALLYNAGTGRLTATEFAGDGSNLTNLPAAGATLSGSTNNTVVTVTGADAMIGEANLVFTGTNLGIGVSDPDQLLEVKSDTATGGHNAYININHTGSAGGYQSGIYFKASDVNCYKIDVTGNGDMTWRQGASETERLLLKGNGQVMINDTSSAGDGSNVPMLTVKLDAANSGEMAAFKWASHSQPVTSYAEADTMFSIRQAGNYAQLGFWGDSGATGGQILAVATSPTTTKSSSTMGAFRIMCSTNNGAATAALGHHNSENNNNMVTMDDNTSTRFLFGANGIAHADDSWADFSDGRLKFNQAVVPYGLAEVMQLQPKIYDKDSGYIVEEEFTDAEGNVVAVGEIVLEGRLRTNIGFVAQEVKAIIPEIVQDVNDFSWYSLNDGKLMAVVVKAIQELKAEIDALKE